MHIKQYFHNEAATTTTNTNKNLHNDLDEGTYSHENPKHQNTLINDNDNDLQRLSNLTTHQIPDALLIIDP